MSSFPLSSSSSCVLHDSCLTLDVFFTEYGCNHRVRWGESFVLRVQHGCFLSSLCKSIFPLLLLLHECYLQLYGWLWCDLFRIPRNYLITEWFFSFAIITNHWTHQTGIYSIRWSGLSIVTNVFRVFEVVLLHESTLIATPRQSWEH